MRLWKKASLGEGGYHVATMLINIVSVGVKVLVGLEKLFYKTCLQLQNAAQM